MCAMRLKARGKYGTYSGTRVPNSANYVPNENCILLKYSILSNSDFSYWKIHVILHREVNFALDILSLEGGSGRLYLLYIMIIAKFFISL